MMWKICQKIFVVLLGVSVSMVYGATDPDKNMNELIGLLDKFDTYKADFAQQTFDQSGEELQNLSGEMILQKPDHFYWVSNDPYAQKLVSNGKNIWHYDADLEQVVIQEYAKQARQAPILVILRDTKTLATSFKVAKVDRKNNTVQFRLESIEKNLALKAIELGFTDGVLHRLGFIDNLQQKTHVVFSSPLLNQKIDASVFEFILPDGVDVLYE
jgi:outer membrane lipoprotein carrier protein